MGTPDRATGFHLILLLGVSAGFQALFLGTGLNVLDEGWPLYAAMRLHQGGVLFDDVFFVFPPGHLLPAWIAYGLDPPGVVFARALYAVFELSLCVAIYFLGRRIMSPGFALLGALLLAVAAPHSHLSQLLFGYRYLAVSAVALLLLERRLTTGDARWMLAAGAATGVALWFRLTPAFAVGVALACAPLLHERSPRRWIVDWTWLGLGILAALIPVVAWFANSVGLETFWREVVIRPVAMTNLQSLPVPELGFPASWNRYAFFKSFVTIEFRAYALLYAGYLLVLGRRWIQDRRRGAEPRDTFLFLVVLWGAVYFLRSLGRSDEPHLDSALPPICLLLAHGVSVLFRSWAPERIRLQPARAWAVGGLCAAVLASWVFVWRSDQYLASSFRGTAPIGALDGRTLVLPDSEWLNLDPLVSAIEEWTDPSDTILDLSASPLIHVLTGRLGPGRADLVMPGTFLDADEERRFVEVLQASPPAVVIWTRHDFDGRVERSVRRVAPRVSRWVFEHYASERTLGRFVLMRPRAEPDPARIRN